MTSFRASLPLIALATLLGNTLLLLAQPLPQRPAFVPRGVGKPPPAPLPEPMSDEKALAAAGLSAEDPAGLVAYLRQRTLTDVDLSKIRDVIKRLGAEGFDDRERASREVERFGPAAVVSLRAAESDPDPEVAYRAAECLRRMEQVPHATVAAAAVRALAETRPPGTVAALLGFLPLADDERVAAVICQTLTALAVRDGRTDPELMKALTDPAPVRRAAAAVAIIEGSPQGERARIKDTLPQLLQAVEAEKDPETKFQMLFLLLTLAREKYALGQLIDLLPQLSRGRLWQAEDYLLQLAGNEAPNAVFGKSEASLIAAQTAWKDWWVKGAPTRELTSFEYRPRVTGRTLLTLLDYRYGTAGSVMELGPDMKERWRMTGLSNPLDAQVLPDGNVVIAEQSASRVTIRDNAGRVLATRSPTDPNRGPCVPQQVQVLTNGNLLVTCQNLIVEYVAGKDTEAMRFVRNDHDLRAARRLANGETVAVVQNPPHILFLDANGKVIPERTLKISPPYFPAHLDEPTPGRLLVTEMNRVAEYDLKNGKAVWVQSVNQPRSVQRLPNGNTLVVESTPNPARVIEYAPSGEEVWSHTPASGFQVFRAYRR